MTLVWLAVILSFVVAATVYACWKARDDFRRSARLIWLNSRRITADIEGLGDDRNSRAVWAAFRHAEYQHAMTLTLARAEMETADRFAELLAPIRNLEVVG